MDKGEKLIKVENEIWEGIHEKLKNRETRKGLNKSRSKAMIERQLEETYKDTGIKHYDKFKNHIEYLQNCFKSGGPVKIGEAKYLVKSFSYSNYPTLGIELDLVFKEFESIKDKDKREEEERDFTIDELIFIQGHLGVLRGHYEEVLRCTLDKKRQKLLKRKVDTLNSIINKISELFCAY